MSNSLKRLAARRAELIEECALQRAQVAQEFTLLRSPLNAFSLDGLRERLAGHSTLLLAVAGVALGFVVTRPKRLLSLASRALPLFGMVRKLLPLLSH
ncbi:YqjK family protein [Massilia horti]|uniref:YqjK-like protein n=1 Tax=Massilia horti TaxID=2562153 RepID=A0A4Y9T966_9BURK|nr:hypothetical protein [Massilia horti]TFW34417.1 hypothetical protein E4O92_04235 [Massilia horti]